MRPNGSGTKAWHSLFLNFSNPSSLRERRVVLPAAATSSLASEFQSLIEEIPSLIKLSF